jgi:hypothetical protein
VLLAVQKATDFVTNGNWFTKVLSFAICPAKALQIIGKSVGVLTISDY